MVVARLETAVLGRITGGLCTGAGKCRAGHCRSLVVVDVANPHRQGNDIMFVEAGDQSR
jgi:hypothetical protein